MELVGSLIGIDTDKGLYTHFKRHHGEWFPALRRIHRTTFTRQAANLWWLKECLWRHVLRHLPYDRFISLVDSFPIPICRFARARRCRRLREEASFGWDEVAKQTFLGLRVHSLARWPEMIVDFRLAPANRSELRLAEEMLAGLQGWASGDRNCWSPRLQEQLQRHDLQLLAPVFSLIAAHPQPHIGGLLLSKATFTYTWLCQNDRRLNLHTGLGIIFTA